MFYIFIFLCKFRYDDSKIPPFEQQKIVLTLSRCYFYILHLAEIL